MSRAVTKSFGVGIMAIGAAAICIAGYQYSKGQQVDQQVAYAKSSVTSQKAQLTSAEQTIQTFYVSQESGILNDNVTDETIDTVTNQLGGVQTTAEAFGITESQLPTEIKKLDKTKETLLSEIQAIKEKRSLQTKIDALFEQAVNWTTYADPAAINEKTTATAISELKDSVNVLDKDSWQTLANQYLDEAASQRTTIDTIQAAIDKMYQNGTATTEATYDAYLPLATDIDAVKNQTVRQTFVQTLNAINEQMGFGAPVQ